MQHDSASARPPGDVMFKSLVLLQIVVTAKALRVVDSQARFKQFYRAENATRVHWTLQVDTKVFGTDFITFFASDIDRYLQLGWAVVVVKLSNTRIREFNSVRIGKFT